MDFVVAPADVERLIASVRSMEGNPIKLAARFSGLGDAEIRSGVPVWAWVALGALAGATLGIMYGAPVRKWIDK